MAKKASVKRNGVLMWLAPYSDATLILSKVRPQQDRDHREYYSDAANGSFAPTYLGRAATRLKHGIDMKPGDKPRRVRISITEETAS